MQKMIVIRIVVAMAIGMIPSVCALSNENKIDDQLKELRVSVDELNKQVKSLNEQMPGLGDRMMPIQQHMAKLYYAGESLNWELAGYELHELEESIKAAMKLNEVKNGVNISGVLESLLNTQIDELRQSIQERNIDQFTSSYNRTVISCNSCHQASGYGFIKIAKPSTPPVTNQDWAPVTTPAVISDTTKADN